MARSKPIQALAADAQLSGSETLEAVEELVHLGWATDSTDAGGRVYLTPTGQRARRALAKGAPDVSVESSRASGSQNSVSRSDLKDLIDQLEADQSPTE